MFKIFNRSNPPKIEKRIDYVLVIDKVMNQTKLKYIKSFVRYLEEQGLQLQVKREMIQENLYIIIYLPDAAIQHFARVFEIDIRNPGHTTYSQTSHANIKGMDRFFKTPLSDGNDLFRRKGNITSKERILIAQQILTDAKFGPNDNERGIDKLLTLGIVKAAYPLHDGDCETNEEDDEGFLVPENDRQLLLKYWANFSLWYKEQPLNLIEKYYGSEVAFYFAWVGFYNKMLTPAAIIGVICSIISIIQFLFVDKERVNDICKSEVMLCPVCYTGKNCRFVPLNRSCEYSKVSIIFDNYQTVFYAVFMSFWATFLINLWSRFESVLKIRWNVEFEDFDTKLRIPYIETATHKKWSSITGELQPYTPTKQKLGHLILSYGACFLLVIIVCFCVFLVITYRVAVATVIRVSGSETMAVHASIFLIITSSCIQVALIQLFGMFYKELAEWLTSLENPRTDSEFDASVVHKRYFLAFTNNYAPLFYHSFLRGRFYRPNEHHSFFNFEADLCDPTGCMMSLCIQLLILMLFKAVSGNILTLILPKILNLFREIRKKVRYTAQWEKEYALQPVHRHMLVSEYMEMMLQYGFVTFFVAAFPLAPLCALLNNCLELRLDAYKLVTRYRRPIPKQESGIGSWNGIVTMITHLSVATNAFVLAFTSDFVVREIYKYTHNNSLVGYMEATLSVFDMRDHEEAKTHPFEVDPLINSTLCYYKDSRYPPDHPNKYTLTPGFWYEVGMRLVCVIVFEHLILFTNGLISYLIPDVPESVKLSLHHHRTQELELKMKAKAENIRKLRRRKHLKVYRSNIAQPTV